MLLSIVRHERKMNIASIESIFAEISIWVSNLLLNVYMNVIT